RSPAAGAHAAGYQQHIQRWVVGEAVVGEDTQPLGAADRVVAAFGNGHTYVSSGASLGLDHSGCCEDLPPADEVKFLGAVEDQQPECRHELSSKGVVRKRSR